ncbi:bacterial transcriptional activator domain-containing protein [Georgenia sp. H159]|uniref:AfsR/SARP family transcriptional regulator n=1 Tax=Georgenia sp. H159 TaxID=3076115 RepID=UPI002D789291|nr:bacterial transcriptional activator domain-containing protein [Georgenia sp. H159]
MDAVHTGAEQPGGDPARPVGALEHLRVFLLGPFAARLGASHPLPVLHKAQDLLALLLLAPGQAMLREAVTDTLWPEARADASRKLMRQALWHVHRAADVVTDERLVLADGDALRINADRKVWLDVTTFTDAVHLAHGDHLDDDQLAALARAADLYRGPLHVGCLDEWCMVPRARLEDQCLTLLDRLSHEHERRRNLDAAIAWAQRVLDIEPAHERSHRRLMRLYYETGDRTRAIRQLQQCRAVLEHELGVRPDGSTESLGASILHGEDAPVDAPAPGWDGPLAALQDQLSALRRSVESLDSLLRHSEPR